MTFEEAQREFGIALGKLKRAYHDDIAYADTTVTIVIDDGDHVTIIPHSARGTYTEIWRGWVDTDE